MQENENYALLRAALGEERFLEMTLLFFDSYCSVFERVVRDYAKPDFRERCRSDRAFYYQHLSRGVTIFLDRAIAGLADDVRKIAERDKLSQEDILDTFNFTFLDRANTRQDTLPNIIA